jgi:uncharacterized protein YhfF
MIAKFWQDFCAAHGLDGPMPPVTCFGDTKQMQTDLAQLVCSGQKCATASLARWYEEDETLPAPGDLSIFVDGTGTPLGVIRTSFVDIAPFHTADAAFAAAEGEGDGSLAYWVAEHIAFFTPELTAIGLAFSTDMDVVFERFELVGAAPVPVTQSIG